MLTLDTKIDAAHVIHGELVLPYALREKSRQRAVLRSGEEVAVFSARGTVLRHGDLLQGRDNDDAYRAVASGLAAPKYAAAGQSATDARLTRVVRIVAAMEKTYRITCLTPTALLRCAFHLGNRHTQAEVGETFLRIRRDPVLKDMLTGLGAKVVEETAAFEPESGAYGGGHSRHHDDVDGSGNLLAPVPLRQKIHRPGDPTDGPAAAW